MISDKQLIEFAKRSYETAKEKGFWTKDRNIDELFMLIISELGEALEAHRKDRWANKDEYERNIKLLKEAPIEGQLPEEKLFELHIKDTVEDEITDAIIRALDYLYFKKHEYIILRDPEVDLTNNFGSNLLLISGLICDVQIQFATYLLFQLCDHMNIDIIWHMEEKMKYNSTRDKLHGKKY